MYWFTDIGRPRNGMFFVESGRLGIEIERESRGARWRTRAGYEWRRTNPREVESVVTTTLRDEARRRASGAGHRRTSPRVPAAPLSLLQRLPEPEVMRTSIDEANVAAVPAAAVRKQERARRRPRQASERRVGHEVDGRYTSA